MTSTSYDPGTAELRYFAPVEKHIRVRPGMSGQAVACEGPGCRYCQMFYRDSTCTNCKTAIRYAPIARQWWHISDGANACLRLEHITDQVAAPWRPDGAFDVQILEDCDCDG